MAAVLVEQDGSEVAKVVAWRERELLDAGYDPRVAAILAQRTTGLVAKPEETVDLHYAVDVIRRIQTGKNEKARKRAAELAAGIVL